MPVRHTMLTYSASVPKALNVGNNITGLDGASASHLLQRVKLSERCGEKLAFKRTCLM